MAKTILLADDSLTIQKVVELTFADTDFDVVSTSSGDELLQKLPSTAPDIVVCDTIMPGIDGYDVCQKIKSDPASLHIPVIMLTGTFEPFDRDRALAVGCSEIITKPFEARKLVETVKALAEGGGVAAPAPEHMEGAVSPQVFEGAVAPPVSDVQASAETPVEEYGTMMMETALPDEAEAAPEEGLDFTSTGFAAMEAAGRAEEERIPDRPDTGLDYESPAETSDFVFGGDTDGEVAEDAPVIDAPPEAVSSGQTQPISAEELAASGEEVEEEHWSRGEEIVEEVVSTGPFGGESGEEDIDTVPPEAFAAAEAAVMEEAVMETADTASFDATVAMDAIPTSEEAQVEAEVFEETPGVDEVPAELPDAFVQTGEVEPVSAGSELVEEALSEKGVEELSEAEVLTEAEEAFPVLEEEVPVPEAADDAAYDSAAFVSDSPVEGLSQTPQVALSGGSLSDDDIDRLARRVLELAADRIERIAWEVIPDMTEIVVRDRVRELEARIEGEDQ